MEVKPKSNVESVTYEQVEARKPRPAPAASDSAQFDGAQSLNQSLETTVSVRPDVVARAQQLLGDVQYPPPQTIHRIAVLLAMHLDGDSRS